VKRNPWSYGIRDILGKRWSLSRFDLRRPVRRSLGVGGSPPTAWQVFGFVGAQEMRAFSLAAVSEGYFTPGFAALHPGLRSGHPSGVVATVFSLA